MRFQLLDRILEVEPGKSIRMVKNLTLAEEYLADHFPTFPVMPGVLMCKRSWKRELGCCGSATTFSTA